MPAFGMLLYSIQVVEYDNKMIGMGLGKLPETLILYKNRGKETKGIETRDCP